MRQLQPVFVCCALISPAPGTDFSTSVYRIGRQIEFYREDRGPVRVGPRDVWEPEDIKRAIAAAFGKADLQLELSTTPREPPACEELAPGGGRHPRRKLDADIGSCVTRGKDFGALARLRERFVQERKAGTVSRKTEVDLHRWFSTGYVFRRRGEWFVRRWSGMVDFFLGDDGEPGEFWSIRWLERFRIPHYAAETDAALSFARWCLPSGRSLSIRQIDTDQGTRWHVDVVDQTASTIGSDEGRPLATAVSAAVLEAVLHEGPFPEDPAPAEV